MEFPGKHLSTDVVAKLRNHLNGIYLSMIYAAINGNITEIKSAIDKGADNYNQTMIYASAYGHLTIVRLMIIYGANNYSAAIIYAIRNGHMEVIKLLLDHGADHNIALTLAIRMKQLNVVEFLMEKGISENSQVLMLASYYGNKDIIKLALENGANNYDEGIAYAKLNKHDDIVVMIKDYLGSQDIK